MTEKRRVVFVSQMYPPEKGGNASRIHDTATQLQDGDWNVSVLCPPPSYPPGEFDRSWQRSRTEVVDGVSVHRLWSWQPAVENPGMARRLPYYLLFGIHAMVWLLLNVRKYDAVVTSTPPISTGAPGLLAALLGKPWLVDVRDLWIDASISLGYLEAGSPVERVSRRFQRLVLHTADAISVTTETLGREIQNQYGDSLGEKQLVIPNGVDTGQFEFERETHSGGVLAGGATSSELGETSEDNAGVAPRESATDGGRKPTLVYTGNLGTAQDLEVCIRALPHLEHQDAVLRLVGSGDMESKLRELARELGVAERVDFVGTVPRTAVPTYLNEATVGVAPLKNGEALAYAMPTKVYEYLACGLPTVVTGTGEIERFIDESGGGFHAANDPESVAERIDRLLADEALRNRMGRQGRDHVVRHYDRRAIADELREKLHRLVEAQD
ncbi:glycosyltransferase family 4 protein [Natronomonas amylolytica]|uniref:glycosyltransferase family 4 protein n=1 Tax=Natronomonas amylolytica TaxID=3108498 RepID=UPI003009BD15